MTISVDSASTGEPQRADTGKAGIGGVEKKSHSRHTLALTAIGV
jgi:hypothetical protein